MISEAGAAVNYGEMPVIRGDEAQIARLFQNLLQNALKFRKKGIPPVIDIATEKTDAGQVFSVRDNGIGIEGQYFERIFTHLSRDCTPGRSIPAPASACRSASGSSSGMAAESGWNRQPAAEHPFISASQEKAQ